MYTQPVPIHWLLPSHQHLSKGKKFNMPLDLSLDGKSAQSETFTQEWIIYNELPQQELH